MPFLLSIPRHPLVLTAGDKMMVQKDLACAAILMFLVCIWTKHSVAKILFLVDFVILKQAGDIVHFLLLELWVTLIIYSDISY